MNKTLIFGHQSPDTDSIMSSLIMENLEKTWGNDAAQACRLGKINKETEYALNYFKLTMSNSCCCRCSMIVGKASTTA